MTKYIFVTGGVVSGLGKGITAASLGRLLKARGLKVAAQKLDPYINVDPGTMSPYQHGEVYVTEDGAETDLDLGHYERFTGIETTCHNSITTGRIYKTVIDRERHGDYLGKTIQVVPHITDEIKRRIMRRPTPQPLPARDGSSNHEAEELFAPLHYREGTEEGLFDFVICEIGGTIGDIESAPFMEAIRQLRWQLGRDAVCVHLTYVPYLKAADELKTKPTQHSVKELQSMGIQPDILVLRTERHLDDAMRLKVASFCNVDLECVVQSEDMPSIYEVPVNMQRQGLDAAILRKIGIPVGETPAMKSWHDFLDKLHHASREVHIGLVGKYDLQDAYKSIRESLNLAGIYNDVRTKLHFINSENINAKNVGEKLEGMQGVLICPGFGQRGIEGKIIAAEYCRTHDVPTFGICLGMQMMVIEFARNVLGFQDANSSEMSSDTKHPVIDLMEDQKTVKQMGGTMRLGVYECELARDSRAYEVYGQESLIKERHRHRYEFNNQFLSEFEDAGMKCVGINPSAKLVEIVEIPDKKWYIGTQFHPEYSSTVLHPHPLFMSFVKACIEI